ncbi:uncharacterized protein LOC111403614 isoform X1 [Olea europaea var. sylvestris]|uniref:Uncharacterized protein n=1 Tax=Olea europaea subsp. europaea TaxID=158383 RepID=A0A8S0VG89_OLEEU|nr:uncharacterized protein LOC111403614 isoform X1 [Olea europaea var. sylvestris]CAA3032740.1 Hypothetical predicted protein [Olea europaea subsp. europaea]
MAWSRKDHHRKIEPSAEKLRETDDHPQFPRNMAYGSPSKERLKGAPVPRNDDRSSTDESDDDNYDRHGGYGGSYSPKMVRTKPEHDTDYASDSPKAGGNPSFRFPAGRKPHHKFPAQDPRYETKNNTAYDNVKGKTSEISKPKYEQQQQVNPHPTTRPGKEDRQEVINCREACNRYGGIFVDQPKQGKEEYKRTINCVEAATKYNGIFVRNPVPNPVPKPK